MYRRRKGAAVGHQPPGWPMGSSFLHLFAQRFQAFLLLLSRCPGLHSQSMNRGYVCGKNLIDLKDGVGRLEISLLNQIRYNRAFTRAPNRVQFRHGAHLPLPVDTAHFLECGAYD